MIVVKFLNINIVYKTKKAVLVKSNATPLCVWFPLKLVKQIAPVAFEVAIFDNMKINLYYKRRKLGIISHDDLISIFGYKKNKNTRKIFKNAIRLCDDEITESTIYHVPKHLVPKKRSVEDEFKR